MPRLGARGTLPLGLAVLTGSFLIFSRMTTQSSYSQVALPGLIVFGIGLGLTMPVTFNSGTRGVEARRTGLASAILSAAQQIGGSFGVALMTSYATQHAEDYVADHTEEVRASAMEAMMRTQALPQSPAGRQIRKKEAAPEASYPTLQAKKRLAFQTQKPPALPALP